MGLDGIPEVKALREKIGLLADDTERTARWAATMARDWMGLTPRWPACCSSTAIPQTPRAGLGRLRVRPAPTDPRQRRGSNPPARRARHLPAQRLLASRDSQTQRKRPTDIGPQHRYLGPIKPLAAAMLPRWHQKNFFKYMRQHHGLDRMVEQGASPIPNTTRLVNPAWRHSTARCVPRPTCSPASGRSSPLASFTPTRTTPSPPPATNNAKGSSSPTSTRT